MSVKLAKYIFRRINGRIVPIRATLQMARPEISAAAAAISQKGVRHTGTGLKKLGKGIDFDVFDIPKAKMVLKVPALNPTREIKSKKLLEAIPNINDKVARAQALAMNLPNYNVPTVETFSVRITKKLKALVQPKVDISLVPTQVKNITQGEASDLSLKSGLNLDAHAGNVSVKGELVDTALGRKLPSYKTITKSVRQYLFKHDTGVQSDPEMAKEILGGRNFGAAPKDFIKATAITERAAAEGYSSKIMRAFNSLRKKGYRLSKIEKGNYSLVSPTERIEKAKSKGISFDYVSGKGFVPRRPKK